MKKNSIIWALALLMTMTSFIVSSQNAKDLTEKEVRTFVTNSLKNQVGYEAAVKGYYEALSKNLVYWFNPVWKNKPVQYKGPGIDNGSSFYEDSVQAIIYDVLLMGDYANVMGNAKSYVAGAITTDRNFSCVVTREDVKLKYIRFMGADHSVLASNFLWPTVAVKSHEDAYFDMRDAMLNLENDKALKISDSLVSLDGSWALAHLGQLQNYYMTDNREKFTESYNQAASKLGNATLAEKHVILSYNTQDAEVTKYHLEQALIYAADDQFIRVYLAYAEKDAKKAIQILLPSWDRFPENGAVNNMLGYKYMDDGQMDKAKQHFEIYLRVYPKSANAHDSYGDYYAKVGDKAKAKEMYLKSYELDKTFTTSKEKAAKL
jgi:tetratricopeptide (TPR) repeat protein